MLNARDLASRLEKVRELRDGRWVGQCPVHQSGNNLYVSDGDKQTLFFCHSGCDKNEILKAIGLTWRDLFGKSAPKRIYNPADDAISILIYRTDAALGKKISNSDARFINAAGKRLRENGYIVNREGRIKRVTRAH